MNGLSYRDAVYGPLNFGSHGVATMVADLLQTPEVYRLRHVRLLNYDVPFVQELATARRYAHSVGTCHLAHQIALQSHVDLRVAKLVVAAALIHDVGIPPYGHLIEAELSRRDPSFSHEGLVRQIIHGTYHATNIYHQILPGRALQLSAVLRRHELDPEEVLMLICPPRGCGTAISAELDIDNIDNVHRMGVLMGLDHVRSNVRQLVSAARLSHDGRLMFHESARAAICEWLRYRAEIYGIMIAHPACVAYNAFLQDMVRTAVDHEVISTRDWFQSDVEFESRLAACAATQDFALQLRLGPDYRLVDYVWLRSTGRQTLPPALASFSPEEVAPIPISGAQFYFWPESRKISRRVRFWFPGREEPEEVGEDSSSILVAVINPGGVAQGEIHNYNRKHRKDWREAVVERVRQLAPGWEHRVTYPETFPADPRSHESDDEQLQLLRD